METSGNCVHACFLCGEPADRGPYVLRLDRDSDEPPRGTRSTSRKMMVCRLCDTAPTLFDQLAEKLCNLNRNRPTYPTRGEQARFVRVFTMTRSDGSQADENELLSEIVVNLNDVVSLWTDYTKPRGETKRTTRHVLKIRDWGATVDIDDESARALRDAVAPR